MIKIQLTLDDDGIVVLANGAPFRIDYPREIWAGFPHKARFAQELVALWTFGLPVLSGSKVHYDFPRPPDHDLYKRWFKEEILSLTDRVWTDSALHTRWRLWRARWGFEGEGEAAALEWPAPEPDVALISFSCGADSLAGLAIAEEMGLEPYGFNSQGVHRAPVNALFRQHLDALEGLSGFICQHLRHEMHFLTGGATWRRTQTMLGAALILPRFCLSALPFAYARRAEAIVFGAERAESFPVGLRKGEQTDWYLRFKTYDGVREMDRWIGAMTGGALRVTSLLGSIHDYAKLLIVHQDPEGIGQTQISCIRFSDRGRQRWCGRCETCAAMFLYLRAMGRDPFEALGFEDDLFDAEVLEWSAAFFETTAKRSPNDWHQKQEQLLALLHAKRRGVEGDAIDAFTEQHQADIEAREAELTRVYLQAHPPPEPLHWSERAQAASARLLARALEALS